MGNGASTSFKDFSKYVAIYESNRAAGKSDEEVYQMMVNAFQDRGISNTLNGQFSSIPLSKFPSVPHSRVITVKGSDSIASVTEVLSSNNILSVPVIDEECPAGGHWMRRYLGTVDMVRISMFVLEKLYSISTLTKSLLEELPEHQVFTDTPVREIICRVKDGPFVPIHVSSSLLDAMYVLGKYHVHRLQVIDNEEVVNVLSQSAVLSAIWKQCKDNVEGTEAMTSLLKRPLSDLGLGTPKKVLSVRSNSPAMDAFRLIKDNNVSAVAVTSAEGAIIGNISARDVRLYVNTKEFVRSTPACDFLQEVATAAAERGQATPNRTPICCRADDTLEVALQKVNENKVHRVYVVDDRFHIVSVVSLGDIISAMVVAPADTYFNDVFTTGELRPGDS